MNQINKYPPLSIMIKPVSGLCNFNCNYCFYKQEIKERKKSNFSFMSISLMKKIIDKITEYPNKDNTYIVFQGGEPLLRGEKFYKEIFEYSKNKKINFSIQTNGSLINKEYCALFKKYKCLIGLSLDGDINSNINRIDKNNNETFTKTYNAMKMLQKEKVEHNILIVINKNNVNKIKNIFDFFAKNNEKYLQFIPCLKTNNNKYFIDSKLYEKYLTNIFKSYYFYYKKDNFISVRNMDNYLNLINGYPAEQCGMNGRCSLQYVIESNGDIYPCDFYCTDEYLINNINKTNFTKLLNNKKVISFINENKILNKCKKCKYYQLCKGGCKRENKDINRCKAVNAFFDKYLNLLSIMFKE